MKLKTAFWINISLVNLFIVALLGALMRFKIGFDFPYFDQKHLQHAHSHFAFVGWITHTLFILMIGVMQNDGPLPKVKSYRRLIIFNLICAYGMIISFAVQGYGVVSISFSTLAVITSYVMAKMMFADLQRIGFKPYSYWFIAALWFNVISSLGTFMLAGMMATHNFNSNLHLGALYFYLHFQYNGFFTFACFGLLMAKINLIWPKYEYNRKLFWLFITSCIPAYFLSTLWANLPMWLYLIVIAAATLQLFAWLSLVVSLYKTRIYTTALLKKGRWLILILCIAVTVKYSLQLGSVIPSISKLAFGFRPIVIAYLHLILLAIISVFIITYMYLFDLIRMSKLTVYGLFIFVAGVYLNEIVLGIQGIASFSYTLVPHVNELLFGIALIILLGIKLLVLSQYSRMPAQR